MMKLTFLGTGTSQGIPVVGCTCDCCLSSDSRDKRLRTSALLTVDGLNILIDAGPDLRQQLLANQITTINAILVTHEHKDHLGGLDDVRPINFRMHSTMNIYGLKRVLSVIEKDYDYAFKTHKYPVVPELKLNSIHDSSFSIGNIEIQPIPVQHLSLPILGFRIRNFAYITDASFISAKSKSYLQNLDTLVINALRHEEHYSHFCLSQALGIIHELQPRQAFLTHVSHEMGKYAEINPTLPKNVFFAYDTLSVEIP